VRALRKNQFPPEETVGSFPGSAGEILISQLVVLEAVISGSRVIGHLDSLRLEFTAQRMDARQTTPPIK
jgi:hypothetical protein